MNSGINFNDYAIKLSRGQHETPQEGMCIMECVAYIQGEEHTDHPKCADPICTSYAIALNDNSTSKQRDRLLPFVMRLAGSYNKKYEFDRLRALLNIGVRKLIPFAARKNGFGAIALSAESIPEITDKATLRFAMQKLSAYLELVAFDKDKDALYNAQALHVRNAANDMIRAMVLVDGMYSREQPVDEAFWLTVRKVAVRGVFYATGIYSTHGLPPEEFQMHCEILDTLLKFTDAAQNDQATQKLSELAEITKDHELNVTFA